MKNYRKPIFAKTSVILLLFLSFLFEGCPDPNVPHFPVGDVRGLRPIYGTSADTLITVSDPKHLKQPAKIYVYGSYLFINERYEGIHIFDNSDAKDPKPLVFIKIKGSVDFAVKNNILYADQFSDLVAIDISDIKHIKVVKKIPGVYSGSIYPVQQGNYFECPDPAKGPVIGWQETNLTNPECYR